MNSRDRALRRRGVSLAVQLVERPAPATIEPEEIEIRANMKHWLLRYRFNRIMVAICLVVMIYQTAKHGMAGFVFGVMCMVAVKHFAPRQDPDLDKYTGRK